VEKTGNGKDRITLVCGVLMEVGAGDGGGDGENMRCKVKKNWGGGKSAKGAEKVILKNIKNQGK